MAEGNGLDTSVGLPQDPALQNFQRALSDPQAQDWGHEQSTLLQDYLTRRDLADGNAQAASALVSNLDTFRQGMVGAAAADPGFTHTALDMTAAHLRGLIASNPHLPDEGRQPVYDLLTRDIQQQIASAAVRSLGDTDHNEARALLGQDRISGLLSDQQKQALNDYIDMQRLGRRVDGNAAGVLAQGRQTVAQIAAAINHASKLYDPNIDNIALPTGWAQAMLKDPVLPPVARAQLLHLYGRLQLGGDAQGSDPYVLADGIRGIAQGRPMQPGEIIPQLGSTLKLGDGLHLMEGAMPHSPADRAEWQSLHGLVDAARRTIAAPENGAAGAQAFGRFMADLMPAYRRAGAGSTNPQAENWLFGEQHPFAGYMPTGNDIVPQGPRQRSLGEIFGAGPR